MTATEGPPGIATTKTIIDTMTETIAGLGIRFMTTMIGTVMIDMRTTGTMNDTGLVVDDILRLGIGKNADLAVEALRVVEAERAASVGAAAAL